MLAKAVAIVSSARAARSVVALGLLGVVLALGMILGGSPSTSTPATNDASTASTQRLSSVPLLSADQTGGDPGDLTITVTGSSVRTGQVERVRYVKSYLSGNSVLDRAEVIHQMLYGNAVIVVEYHVSKPQSPNEPKHSPTSPGKGPTKRDAGPGKSRATSPGVTASTGVPVLALLSAGALLVVLGMALLLLLRRRGRQDRTAPAP